MTRDQARELFKEAGLSYSILNKSTMQRLRYLINEEMKKSGLIRNTFRCRQRVNISETSHGLYVEIRCRSICFDDREAVSFNTDNFIGFAGWADEDNIRPILAGFKTWVIEMKDSKS